MKPIATPVRDTADIERAISAFAQDFNGGLIVLPSAFIAVHRQVICEQAAQHRLPAVYGYRYFAADGGLMSYGVDVHDLFRRSAAYVDRSLGCQARRTSRASADQIRTHHQPEDRQITRYRRTLASERCRRGDRMIAPMSAFGTKRTCASALHMSAFGVKRTCLCTANVRL